MGTPIAMAREGVFAFGAFRLDVRNARLSEGSRPLELAPKPFAVLCHLAQRPGLLVTKDELLDAVWGHRFVSESVVKSAVNLVRAALRDDPRQPRYLETVARRGYRFVGELGVSAPGSDSAVALRSAAAMAALAPSLTGRAQACQQLAAWLDASAAGRHQLVLVGGEAGIGKSTLLRTLADQPHARMGAESVAFSVAFGQCVEQTGGGEPYLPILDALAELAGGPHGAAWRQGLRSAAPTWLAQLPWLVDSADAAALQRELAGAAQDRMLREFGALLDVATPEQPLLLVIEDMHWSDHATVSLLDYLARRRGPGRWMLAASYRTGDSALAEHPLLALRQELRLHGLCRELLLLPFSEADVACYLQQRLGDGPTPQRAALADSGMPQRAALARALHQHTEGLPLFLANVVDDLGSGAAPGQGLLDWADPAAELARQDLPATVSGIIERQIGRLPPALRGLLEVASVVGQEFSVAPLAELLGVPIDRPQDQCAGLVQRGEWLRDAGIVVLADGSPSARYAFRHALYRRVFLQRIAPARKVALHLQAAAAALRHLGGGGEHRAAALAQHHEAALATAAAFGAELPAARQQAIAWRLRAARAAAAVHAPIDALAHYAMAERTGPSPHETVQLLSESAALHQQLGAGVVALLRQTAALQQARSLGDAGLLQSVMLQQAQLSHANDKPLEAIALIDELLGLRPGPDADLRAAALVAKADALDSLGHCAQADAAAAAALDCLPAGADAARARHLASRVNALFHRGEFQAGLPLIAAALALYERSGDAAGAAAMRNRQGVFALQLGQLQDAEAALLDALARTRALRDVPGQRRAILNLVKLRSDCGDASGALALLDAGWALSPSFEGPTAECAFLSGYYYCNYLLGDLGAALRDAGRVLACAQGLASVYWRVGSLCLVSDLYIHLGLLDQAQLLIEQALAQSRDQAVDHLAGQVQVHRAWLDVLTGRPDEALARMEAALPAAEASKPEDQAALARVRAQALLALGRPQEALAVLAAFDSAPTQEVWTLMLALRLRAQCMTGTVVEQDLARAQTDLLDSRTPALESLVLRGALVEALNLARQPSAAASQGRLLLAHRQRLADSLAADPEQQQAFLALGMTA